MPYFLNGYNNLLIPALQLIHLKEAHSDYGEIENKSAL